MYGIMVIEREALENEQANKFLRDLCSGKILGFRNEKLAGVFLMKTFGDDLKKISDYTFSSGSEVYRIRGIPGPAKIVDFFEEVKNLKQMR